MTLPVREVMVVGLATLIGGPLPILPLQILFLNLVTDIFPALALGMGGGNPTVMRRPPRDPADPILKRRHWQAIASYGGVMTASVLGAMFFALEVLRLPVESAVTVSFLSLAFGQLWHVFNMRSSGSHMIRNEVVANPYVWGAVALCTVLLLGAVYLPASAQVLRIVPPGTAGWLTILVFSSVPLLVGQAVLSQSTVSDRAGANG